MGGKDGCPHVWVYDHKETMKICMRCQRCGAIRETSMWDEQLHPFRAMQTARELNIRIDGKDGDV